MMRRLVVGLVVGALAATLYACASMEPAAPPADAKPSLYKRLGGREGIALVVDDAYANVAADNRVNARFKGLKPEQAFKLKSNLADQICDATGGPCSYVGGEMAAVHKGMKITEDEWNAFVEDLVKALDKNKVAAADKDELLKTLAPLKPQIVGQ